MPIAAVMAPKTMLERMATTRPRNSGGVTWPKMVWVGTTYTRFAMPMTPAEIDKFVVKELAANEKLIKAAGVK